eukprot:2187616-Rhodomonas_salina.2
MPIPVASQGRCCVITDRPRRVRLTICSRLSLSCSPSRLAQTLSHISGLLKWGPKSVSERPVHCWRVCWPVQPMPSAL